MVLEAVEATDGWATSVRPSKPPMTIMGELGGIEAGLCQLRISGRGRPGLAPRWHDWSETKNVCLELAYAMLGLDDEQGKR